MKLRNKFIVSVLGFVAFTFAQPAITVHAEEPRTFTSRVLEVDSYSDTSEGGTDSDALRTASYISVNKLTKDGLRKVLLNPNLKKLDIADISNLPVEDVSKLYNYLCENNIEYSAILLAYENIKDSVGNDGTEAYVNAVDEYAADASAYYRSCATTVSTILNAAGYVDDYSSAGVSGLVSYFEAHPDDWECMGKLSAADMQEGDVIFIDRQSHKEDYIKGILSDSEFDLNDLIEALEEMGTENASDFVDETLDLGDDGDGWYDEGGNFHKSENQDYGYYDPSGAWCPYETGEGWFTEDCQFVPFTEEELAKRSGKTTYTPPSGGYKVFNPDSNGDGTIDDSEAKVWSDYWMNATGKVPDYSYYDTWKKEADEYQEKLTTTLESLDVDTLKALNGGPVKIHNHIVVWLGNDVIQKYYPDSNGNIVSGSYSEAYSRARSAAVSTFNFKGDYKIYRFVGEVDE